MYLNAFAMTADAHDMTTTDEFESLKLSAQDLGIAYPDSVRYVARNVIVNGLRFNVLEWGLPSNPPLVLLHGGNQTAHSWDLVSLALADRFHIIAPDQRGHGDSEWPRDGELSPLRSASDAESIVRHLGLVKPTIIGHSMGGIVTLCALKMYPGFAEKAVIVDVGPELSEEGTRLIGEFVRTIGEYESVGDFVEKVVAYDPLRSRDHIARTARYNLLLRADGRYVSKHDIRRFATPAGASSNAASYRPTIDEVRDLDLPVLVVRGELSSVLTDEAALRFQAALPRGELVTVPGAGHNVHSQNTRGFLDRVSPFLAGNTPGR